MVSVEDVEGEIAVDEVLIEFYQDGIQQSNHSLVVNENNEMFIRELEKGSLVPETEYSVNVYAKTGSINGPVTSQNFTTGK